MEYFGIIDKNVAAILKLQWKIWSISDMFLQYSVLCGLSLWERNKLHQANILSFSYRK